MKTRKQFCNTCCGYGVTSDHLGFYVDVCEKCNGNSAPHPTLEEKLYELAKKWELDMSKNNEYDSCSSDLINLLEEFGNKKEKYKTNYIENLNDLL